MFRSLLFLLAPMSCAGCLRPDVALCDRCARRLKGPLSFPSIAVATALWGVPVISGGPYRGARRRVVGAIKDGGARHLTGALVGTAMVGALAELGHRQPGLVLVPVPASARGFFLRGFWPTVLIARVLSERSGGVPVIRGLSLGFLGLRNVGFGLERHARSRTVRLARRWTRLRVHHLPARSQVVLVDDVMATGATVEACARALRQQGHNVLAVFVVAHVPAPHRTPFPRSGTEVYSERTTLTRRT